MKLKILLSLFIGLLSFSSVWAAIPSKGGVTTDCAIRSCEPGDLPKRPPT